MTISVFLNYINNYSIFHKADIKAKYIEYIFNHNKN